MFRLDLESGIPKTQADTQPIMLYTISQEGSLRLAVNILIGSDAACRFVHLHAQRVCGSYFLCACSIGMVPTGRSGF